MPNCKDVPKDEADEGPPRKSLRIELSVSICAGLVSGKTYLVGL